MSAEDSVGQALMQLSDKLGLATEQVFNLYVQAQTALAIKSLVIGTISLSVAGLVAYKLYNLCKREVEDDEGEELSSDEVFLVVAMSALITGFLTAGLLELFFGEIIMRLIAPEYMAAEQLMSKLGGVVQ